MNLDWLRDANEREIETEIRNSSAMMREIALDLKDEMQADSTWDDLLEKRSGVREFFERCHSRLEEMS